MHEPGFDDDHDIIDWSLEERVAEWDKMTFAQQEAVVAHNIKIYEAFMENMDDDHW